MEKKIKDRAKQKNVTVSNLILDYVEKDLRRNTKSDKKRVTAMVKLQDLTNQLIEETKKPVEQQNIRELVQNIAQEELEIWDN
jgi:hypothetical protein